NDISAPQHLSQRILDVMAGPFEIDGQSARIGVSIGIAMAPENSLERNELMRLADLALYRAKNNGRNCFIFYDEKMNMELQKRKAIEDELRAAIQNEELDVFYQPIISTQTRKLTSVEALVRWPHQKRGLINPDDFISIAEERGLIFSLGEWVLRRACMDALHWPGIKLSVNISASQFRQENFVSSIKTILNETGFDPARLELELTESVVINDARQAEEAMIELRSMGIRVALDDFGTGYSSLIYLRRFAIDKIKIDKSFLQTMEMSNEAEEIVGNIVDLGRRLGLIVTAEGVETPEQAAFLEATGCHELQGYLFGRPQPRLSVAALIGRDMISAAKPQTAGHQSQGPQAVRA
ncbi:MAG: EAL domain-containing protein, partial [Alphaproteobacteria bacterium]|nr:EAL domain-containing protein [Alphaproteobacteria bacterium]